MSKKVKKNNTIEDVTTNKTADLKVEVTSTTAVQPEAADEVKKEAPAAETKEAKPAKETKTTAKKTTEKKASAKASVKEVKEAKAPEKPVEQIFVQYAGNEYAAEMIVSKVKAAWVEAGHKAASIKALNLYIKPEENAAYYVINDKETGKLEL